jgi:MHS family alpha-ketoglutarate permease-like MFS transporter
VIPTQSAAAGSHPDRRAQVEVILAGSVPNLVQWFYLYLYLYLYATFAPYFRTEFFDPDSPDSLIYVYGLFALAFVVRPLGSWLFGRLADTRGRQRALVAAVTMMSAGSVALAVAPTERAVGAWAAVILVVVSLLQGIATGGEYAAATVLLSESGTRGHRGFFASFQATTIVGGLVLAQACLLVLLLVSDRVGISEWGWWVAFAAGLASLLWARGFERGAVAAGTAGSFSSKPALGIGDVDVPEIDPFRPAVLVRRVARPLRGGGVGTALWLCGVARVAAARIRLDPAPLRG